MMGDSVDTILTKVLRSEGGYQDKQEDDGNWYKGKNLGTNMGITPHALAKYRGTTVTKKDMLNLTEKEAREIYRQDYVAPIVRNLNPPADVLPQLVDMAINHGYGNTVVMVQRAVGTQVDGKAGPGTRKALQALDSKTLNNNLVNTRKQFYSDIVKRDSKQQVFLRGWLNRAEEYTSD
jgi:lysozyme family protein